MFFYKIGKNKYAIYKNTTEKRGKERRDIAIYHAGGQCQVV